MNRAPHLALVAGLLASISPEVAAQSAEGAESWWFAFTPYAWISGIRGTIGVGSSTGEVDVAFNEGGEDFEFGFAGLLEARRRRWVARTDFFYVSFSDEQGTAAGNHRLGAARAGAVAEQLVLCGVAPSRIESTSYGDTQPACVDGTDGCHDANRRVGFEILPARP